MRRKPPTWTRGNLSSFIDSLTIPEPPLPDGKDYAYRVVKGDTDLGVQQAYVRDADGSQRINLLEYNKGYGVADRTPIRVYAVAQDGPEKGEELLVAQWR